MSRRTALVLAGAIALLAPFGEGGRAPLALLVLHTLALVCVVLTWSGPAGERPRNAPVIADPTGRIAALAAAGLGLALISALRASYPLAAALGTWDLAVPFALFATAARAATGDRDLERMRAFVVASTSLQALLTLLRYPRGGVPAAGASFLNPNHLAAYLNVGLFLALTSSLAPAARRARATWGAVAALHLVALFLLESRGAFAGFFAALVVLGARHFSTLSRRGRTIAIGAALAIVLVAAVVLSARFSRSFDPYRYSRVAIWKATGRMIAERPWFGFGPGMFPHVSARFNFPAAVGPVRYGRTFQGAHSAFLTLMAEAGVPAAVWIVAAIVTATILFLRARAGGPGGAVFGVGLAILALLVQGCAEDLQTRPALTFVPTLLAGAAWAAVRRRRPRPYAAGPAAIETDPLPSPSREARVAGATVAIYLFVIAVLLPFWADREAVAALRLGRSGLPRMEKASALNPLHPEYRNDLAMAILNSGPLTPEGYARAASDLLEAWRLKPIDYRFPLHLARLEARFAVRLFDDPTAMERASGLYREAVRLAPLDPRPRLELAGHLVDQNRPFEALRTVREALDLEPDFLRGRILEASVLLDLGRREESRSSLRLAEATLRSLAGYEPDSGYAREIVMDARIEREHLASALGEDAPSKCGQALGRELYWPFASRSQDLR